MKWKFLMLTLLLTFGMMPSCGWNCKCGDIPRYRKIKTFQILNSADTLIGISKDHLNFTFQFTFDFHSQRNNTFFDGIYGSPLYACKCAAPGFMGTKEKIDKIHLIAIAPYDTFQVGDTITSLFQMRQRRESNMIPVENYVAQDTNLYEDINCMLRFSPSNPSILQFKTQIVFKDLSLYEAISTPTKVK